MYRQRKVVRGRDRNIHRDRDAGKVKLLCYDILERSLLDPATPLSETFQQEAPQRQMI